MKYIFSILSTFLIAGVAVAGYDDPFYDFRGFNPTRGSYSYEPEEHLDPFTGNFTLIYTDIHLPGNGGLDLTIMRVYNSDIYRDWEQPQIVPVPDSWVGFGWSMHMGRLVFPNLPNLDGAYLIMPDGSNHTFYQNINNPEHYISKDYWIMKLTRTGFEVLFTDGVKWTFDGNIIGSFPEVGGPVTYYPTVQISDPSGANTIEISYINTGTNEAVMTNIEDACGRQIGFTINNNNLQKITVYGNEYRFEYDPAHIGDYALLRRVRYPEDHSSNPTYEYEYRDESVEYDGEMIKRYTPWRGNFEYVYNYHTFNIGGEWYTFRVLTARLNQEIGWAIDYAQVSSGADSTTITNSFGHKTIYKMFGYNMEPIQGDNWKIGLILRKKIMDAPVCPLWIIWDYEYDHSDPISNEYYYGPTSHDIGVYVPELTLTKITEHSRDDYGTAYTVFYNTEYQNYEYGHPTNIVETNSYTDEDSSGLRSAKFTNITYWYNFPKNIINKIQRKEVYCSDITGTHHIEEYDYSSLSGKMESKTIDGIITKYRYYSSNWNLKKVTDGMNRCITYDLYDYGLPQTINNGIYTIQRDINWEGTIKWEKNGNGHTTVYDYDGRNRLKLIDPPIGNSTIITYASDNKSKTVSLGDGYTIEYYDNFGRLDLTENSAGIKVDYDYNFLDWLIYKSFPFDNSTPESGIHYTYDYLGRIKRKQLPGHWAETFHYYNGGSPVIVYKDQTAHEGHHIRYAYRVYGNPYINPLLDRVILKYQNNSYSKNTHYKYNNADRLTQIQWEYNQYTREFNYEPSHIGLLQNESSPERGITQYTYENNGNLRTRTDANGNTTTYTYDYANRLQQMVYNGGSEYDVTYIYDNADNVRRITTHQVVKRYGYDAMNRVTGDTLQIDGQEFRVYYDYDGNGNLEYITYPDETVVQYTYDNENRVLTIPGYIDNNITYHPSGSASLFQTSNGCQTSVTFHDDRYFVKRIQITPYIMDEEYDYDQSGNLTSLTDHLNGNNDQVFTYDDFHRLEEFNAPNLWGAGSYGYENVCLGRREYENINGSITNNYYNNTTKRLDYTTGVCACDFKYDANGNICGITGDKTLTMKYDYENRPISIIKNLYNNVTCVYDGNGQRVRRYTPFRDSPYYYMTAPCGGVLYEYHSGSLKYFKYVFLHGKLLVKIDRDGNEYFYHNDYLGTPKVMTNASQSKVYEWLGYPFGKEYWVNIDTENPFRFTGKEFDKFNDMYYYGARYYSPDFGIFITPEPFMGTNALNLTNPLSLAFYDYCRNNPTKYVDPDGRRAMTPREVEIARQIMVKAEQSYFREKSRAHDKVRYTGGSWPEDIAADRIEPVSLKGLPGELSLKYMLKLRGEQLLSILSRGAYSPETEPLLEKVLWSIGTNDKIRVDLQLRKDLQKIYKIVYTKRTDQKYDIFYLGKNDNITVIYRTLSPQAFKDWLKQIEKYKGE
ncbi:hypothetical protein KAX97_09915 [candidate division WOR-3 bacterium]|nr:hypothetical protein [candidate division WOR-3 bacterium]